MDIIRASKKKTRIFVSTRNLNRDNQLFLISCLLDRVTVRYVGTVRTVGELRPLEQQGQEVAQVPHILLLPRTVNHGLR